MAKKPTNEELKKRLEELQEELKLAQKALMEYLLLGRDVM